MHHKRGRPKSTRSGCLMCKPYKRQGACTHSTNMRFNQLRRYAAGEDQLREAKGFDCPARITHHE